MLKGEFKYIFVFGLLALIHFQLQGQSLFCSSDTNSRYKNFVVQSSGISQMTPYSIAPVKNGYWFGGLIQDNLDGIDFFLGKLNDTTGVDFLKSYGGKLRESGYPIPIAPLNNGGCLIGGRTDAGNGLAEIICVSPQGAKKWSKQSPKITDLGYDAIRGVYQDNKSNILAVGTGIQKTGKANLIVFYLDTTGKTLWSRNIDFGGSQHHFNAIAKKDTIFVLAGWCTVNSGISPIVAFVGESGAVLKSYYCESSQTTTYSDVVVSGSGIIYLLGYTGSGSSQYMHVAAMQLDGKVLWRKYLGYGTDVGNSIMLDDGKLWVSGNTKSFNSVTREYYCVLDTSGSLLNYGGLFFDNWSFVTRHQGRTTNRGLRGGVVAVGADNSSSTPHISFLFTNPCDSNSCANNKISKPKIDKLDRINSPTPKLIVSDNGVLENVDMDEKTITMSSVVHCGTSPAPCKFDAQRLVDTSYFFCSNDVNKKVIKVNHYPFKVTWWDGDTASSKEIINAGKYWVRVYNECGERRDTFEVEILNPPTYYAAKDTLFCDVSNPKWDVDVTQPNCTYLWNDNTSSPTKTITNPGVTTVQIRNSCGNQVRVFEIKLGQSPFFDMPDSIKLCEGTRKELSVFDYFTASPGMKNNYQWNSSNNTSSFWVSSKGYVRLEVSNECGRFKDSTYVHYSDCYCFSFLPNAFTPRYSQGLNDVWVPVFTCPIKEGWLSIYNRWGEKLVDQIPVLQGWDGTYMGELVPEGVYAFLIHGYYNDNVPGIRYFTESGNITVLSGKR